VGHDLKVQAMLTGKVVQLGDTLSITAELADARDNAHIWGGQYKRRVSEILTTPEEVARDVSGKLRPQLSNVEQARLSKRYTENSEAYQLYEKGRFFWNKRTPEDMKKAVANFQEAISVDPRYALAYSGLADCYALGAGSPSQPKESMAKAREAALNALEIDETIAEAHTSLALVKFLYIWDWPGAEREFRRAIELNRNYATAHQWYAEYLAVMRRLDEALGEVTEAQKIDPLSLIISSSVGRIRYYGRQFDPAIEQYRKTLEMDQNFALSHIHLGMAYEAKGQFPEAVAEYMKEDTLSGLTPQGIDALTRAYGTDGWKGFWKKELELAMQRSKTRSVPPPAYPIAQVYARLEESDRALEWLHKAYDDKDHFLVWLNVEPVFDGLHPDRGFKDLVSRIGLP
jgi:tetratricopeptide (TPR) repeat protein